VSFPGGLAIVSTHPEGELAIQHHKLAELYKPRKRPATDVAMPKARIDIWTHKRIRFNLLSDQLKVIMSR
jgi:hypothetical protein